jgi:hypothetical protein
MTSTTHNRARRIDRVSRKQWVPIGLMRVAPQCQRVLTASWVKHLAENFDPEQLGLLVVNKRDGFFYLIDGQHRKEALAEIGYGDQQVECEIYEGLTEAEEAEMFLRRNDQLTVTALAKFKVGITAGRPTEVAINTIVTALGLKVGNHKTIGCISAVGTLTRVYHRDGPDMLCRALTILRDAYGQQGFEKRLIDGIAMLCHRYNGDLDDKTAITKLATVIGGVNGLLGKADILERTTQASAAQCVAAAAVDIYNRKPRPKGPGGKSLPNWWGTEMAA